MLPEGLTIFAGKGKIGKSWQALDFAVGIASGTKVFDQIEVQPGDVLYLALEDNQRRMQDRIKKLGRPAPANLTIAHEWPRLDEGGLDAIEGWLDDHKNARMIIIDVLARFKGQGKGRGNAYELDYEQIAPIQALAKRRGVAILVVHHLRKGDAQDPMDLVSGSLGQVGPADGVLILRRKRGDKHGSLFVMGRDIKDERDLAVQFNDARWKILGNAEEIQVSDQRQRVLDYLKENNDTPQSVRAVSRDLDINWDAARKLLRRMYEAGQLGKDKVGNMDVYYRLGKE
jgi:RecA-family ATPase